MLSPPKPLDQTQPNLVCELLTCMGRAAAKTNGSAPQGPGEGSKGRILFNYNYKVNFKDFFPNFVCVLTNERYKIYQTGCLFCRLGHALGVGLGVLRGQNLIPSCCLSVMLYSPKPFGEIQLNLVCGLLPRTGRATAIFFCPALWGPGEWSKGQISFNFNYKVNFKDFIPNFVYVLTNERYQTYQTGLSFCILRHAPGVGL